MYSIYEIWFHFFCLTIPQYDDKTAAVFIDFAIHILKEITKKKIYPTISFYSKLIRACGRQSLSDRVMQVFSTMPKNFKQNNVLYYNSFMNGLYDQDSIFPQINNSTKSLLRKRTKLGNYFKESTNPSLDNMSSLIFLGFDYCYNCYYTKKIKRKIALEEALGGFKKEYNNTLATCNICMKNYQPL